MNSYHDDHSTPEQRAAAEARARRREQQLNELTYLTGALSPAATARVVAYAEGLLRAERCRAEHGEV